MCFIRLQSVKNIFPDQNSREIPRFFEMGFRNSEFVSHLNQQFESIFGHFLQKQDTNILFF